MCILTMPPLHRYKTSLPKRPRIGALLVADHLADHGSESWFRPNRRTSSRRLCAPSREAPRRACCASAPTARKSGCSRTLQGCLAGTLPTAVAVSSADGVALADESRHSQERSFRDLPFLIVELQTTPLPVSLRPNLPAAAN